MAVDHVVVAVAHGAGAQLGRVGAGGLGLGHRKATAELPFQAGFEPLSFLLGRAELGQDLHVAGIRRRAIEDIGPNAAAAHDLAQRGVFGVLKSLAVLFIREEQVPQPLGFGLLAQLGDDFGFVMLVARGDYLFFGQFLVRIDVFVHEGADAPAVFLGLG